VTVPYCRDCERHFPGGEGLKDGRCPGCAAIFEKAQAEAPPADEPAEGEWEEE